MIGTRSKKIIYFVYCAVFFVAALIPAIMTPFAPGVVDRDTVAGLDADVASGEDVDDGGNGDSSGDVEGGLAGETNRVRNGIKNFSDFSARFGLRDQFIALDAKLRSGLFNESANEKIVIGKDGWLFLAETLDWSTVANKTLEITAARIARTLWLEWEYIKKNGAEFIFMPVPNKARVYSDYLPYYNQRPGRDGSVLLDLVQERLSALDVVSVDLTGLFARLRVDNPDTLYYHRLDTHWTNAGAIEAYRMLMAEFESAAEGGFAYNSYIDFTPRSEADWAGDLDRMLNPLSERMDTQIYYDIINEYRSRKPIVNLEEMNIESTAGINDMRVLFFRDSFANALIQFFSNNLGKATYTRSMPFPLWRVEDGAYDFVVVEIVERNLGWITDAAPDMPAPLRLRSPAGDWDMDGGVDDEGEGISVIEGVNENVGADADIENLYGAWKAAQPLPEGAVVADYPETLPEAGQIAGLKVSGCFDPSFLSVERELRVYPVIEKNGGETLLFEAFPILTPEMREIARKTWGSNVATEPEINDEGFVFLINDLDLSEGDYIIRVLLVSQNKANDRGIIWSGISEPLFSYTK